MRPRCNAQRERSTTQSERTKRFIGCSQSTVRIRFAECDGKQSERAVDAPSLSGFVAAMRERDSGT